MRTLISFTLAILLFATQAHAQKTVYVPPVPVGFSCNFGEPIIGGRGGFQGWTDGSGAVLCELQYAQALMQELNDATVDISGMMRHCWTVQYTPQVVSRSWAINNDGNLAYYLLEAVQGGNPLEAQYYFNGGPNTCAAPIPSTDFDKGISEFLGLLPQTMGASAGVASGVQCLGGSSPAGQFACACPSPLIWGGGEYANWGYGNCGQPSIVAQSQFSNSGFTTFDPPCPYHGAFKSDSRATFFATKSTTNILVRSYQFDPGAIVINEAYSTTQLVANVWPDGTVGNGDFCNVFSGRFGCQAGGTISTYVGEPIVINVYGKNCQATNGEVSYDVWVY